MIATVDRLVELVRESRILDPAQLDGLRYLQSSHHDPHALAEELLRRDWVSDYQLRQIVKGRVHDLVLGSYVIVDTVGQGAMAQVFKAKRRRDGQIVALKVIRS